MEKLQHEIDAMVRENNPMPRPHLTYDDLPAERNEKPSAELYRCACGMYLQDELIVLKGECPYCDKKKKPDPFPSAVRRPGPPPEIKTRGQNESPD